MRIALIGRRFDPTGGGTERDLIVTGDGLAAAGHAVTYYTAEIRGQVCNPTVHRVPVTGIGRTLRLLTFATRAARIARNDGAEIVLSFARTLGADILRSGGSAHSSYVRASRAWQTPLPAAAMRISPYHRAQILLERRAFRDRQLKLAIAVSNCVRDDLIATFKLQPSKVVTLYNGVDYARFARTASPECRAATRSELGLPDSLPIIAFVGNGFGRKGLRFLIEAWTKVGRDAHLVVVGADQSIGRYRRLAERLGQSGRIHFVGAQPRIERVFTAVDACAMPSLFEPFGNVVVEAMAAGLPVLCSRQCGAAEVLPSTMREFIVDDPTDRDELAHRLNALLAAPPELGRITSENARRFSWADYHAQLNQLLDNLPY
jgi:UDP-glucose:(heptosyl)LPS alpha-1,3-glucosyltransferase